MKRDRIDDILRKKLYDFSLPRHENDWQALEKELGISPKPRYLGIIKFSAVAASLAIALVTGIYFFNRTDEFTLMVREAGIVQETHEKWQHPGSSPAMEAIVSLKNALDNASTVRKPASDLLDVSFAMTAGEETPISAGVRGVEGEPEDQHTGPSGTTGGRVNDDPARGIRPNMDWRPDPRGRRARTSGGWSLALYADGSASMGNTGGTGNSNGSSLFLFSTNSPSTVQQESAKYDHNIPLTFGLTFRKKFTDKWGLESGVVYTYHSAKRETSSVKNRQNLHYLGIPVSAIFTAYQNKSNTFELYGKAGIALDLNLYGEQSTTYGSGNRATTKVTGDGVIFSTSASVGAMYKMSPSVGIYFEPGIGYYFENKKQPESYWTDNPLNFNMKIGFRTTF